MMICRTELLRGREETTVVDARVAYGTTNATLALWAAWEEAEALYTVHDYYDRIAEEGRFEMAIGDNHHLVFSVVPDAGNY